jgi:hypothetical protein
MNAEQSHFNIFTVFQCVAREKKQYQTRYGAPSRRIMNSLNTVWSLTHFRVWRRTPWAEHTLAHLREMQRVHGNFMSRTAFYLFRSVNPVLGAAIQNLYFVTS